MGEKKKLLLRIDPDLFEALERWSADEFRSVNAQIEYLLRQVARKEGRLRKDGSPQAETTEESDTGGNTEST